MNLQDLIKIVEATKGLHNFGTSPTKIKVKNIFQFKDSVTVETTSEKKFVSVKLESLETESENND